MIAITLVAGPHTFSSQALIVCGILTATTLCVGHSIGFHRLLIHRSFECPRWLEYCMVTAGVIVGIGGPRKMIYMHDIRDWSQRHSKCHAFYIHESPIWKDWIWNLHCELLLDHPPEFRPEPKFTDSRWYRFLDRYWMLVQLPLALILYLAGGWTFLVWGICVRIVISHNGHWFIGYLAHNGGPRSWHLDGHAVQGYNVPGFGLLSMGEAWHNNHHAFPESARMGLEKGQNDPGWWLLMLLRKLGLIWNVKEPADLPQRKELREITSARIIVDAQMSTG